MTNSDVRADGAREAVGRTFRATTPIDLLAKVFKHHGWPVELGRMAAKFNTLYEMTADPRANRYVATPRAALSRPANPSPPAMDREAVGYQLLMANGRWTRALYDFEDAKSSVDKPNNLISEMRPVFALTGTGGGVPEGDRRLRMFLEILAASGGKQDASDYAHNWINAFCSDHEGREPDTFNTAIDRKLARSSHDSDTEHSVVWITDAGRAYLSTSPDESRSAEG